MPFLKNILQLDRAKFSLMIATALLALMFGCKEQGNEDSAFAKAGKEYSNTSSNNQPERSLSQQWKDYWYAGQAEITSYNLKQSRYGEIREGSAALIFVTEDFLPKAQVKANRKSEETIPVLKLNATKKFITGIYPYSLMTSTFYPIQKEMHALKVSQSMQEWCGQTYSQLNNRAGFEVMSHSYFQGEADMEYTLPKAYLENQLWTQLRIDPQALPIGSFKMIPDLNFTAMKHVDVKAYQVNATLTSTSYTVEYPELRRKLIINFTQDFPYTIESWEDTYPDTASGELKTTKATKMKTIKSAYWGKNSNADIALRKDLGLL